jgi:transposase-like protein
MKKNEENRLVMMRLQYLADVPSFDCPCCSSSGGQWRGYRSRKDGTVLHRRRCSDCGRWYSVEMRIPSLAFN